MAENKKRFLAYCDWLHVVEKLIERDRIDNTNNSGELFFHLLQYVNDKNPEPVNFVVDVSFESMKQTLKRDLKNYELICDRNKINGLKGGRPKNPEKPKKPSGLSGNPKNPDKPDTDTDTDTVIVTDINNNEFDFIAEDSDLGQKKKIMYDSLMNNQQWHEQIFKELDIDFPVIKFQLDKFLRSKFLGISQMEHITNYKSHFINTLKKQGIRVLSQTERTEKMNKHDD